MCEVGAGALVIIFVTLDGKLSVTRDERKLVISVSKSIIYERKMIFKEGLNTAIRPNSSYRAHSSKKWVSYRVIHLKCPTSQNLTNKNS